MSNKLYNSINKDSNSNKEFSLSRLEPVGLVKDKTKNMTPDYGYPNKFTIDKSNDFTKYKEEELITVVDLSFKSIVDETYLEDGTLRSNGGSAEGVYHEHNCRFQWVLYPKISDNPEFMLPFTELTSYGLDEINGVLRVNLETLKCTLDGRYFHYNSNGDYSYETLIYTFYRENFFGDEYRVKLPVTGNSDTNIYITLSDLNIDIKRVPIGYMLKESN